MKIIFLFLFFLILFTGELNTASAQVPYPIELKNNCEENASTFWAHGEYFLNDKKIFVIGRLGISEKSKKLNLSRIEAVVSKLTTARIKEGISRIGGFTRDGIVTAQGEPIGKLGIVEVYGNGYLLLVFEIGKNEQLKLGNCELEK